MKTRAEFLKEANKRIGKSGSDLFAKYKVKTDWCMMQVYYFMHDVCEISDFPKTFSCSGFTATSFARKRMNHEYSTAEVGDIVPFEINGNKADGADHVGIVIENTGSSIKLLEGNTNGDEDGDFCGTSTSNVFEYPYDSACFDCIIDMSEFFDDKVEEKVEEKQPVDETEDTFTFSMRVLKKGCKGKDVKRIQHLLIQDGYSCGHWCDDGDFGNATEKAVIAWQKAHRLTSDGIFGKETMTEFMKR